MQVTRVFDFLERQQREHPLPNCLNFKQNGKWVALSTAEVVKRSEAIARGLLQFGLQKGDAIAIISDSCVEWNLIDYGAQQIGVVVVPIFPTLNADTYEYILNHSGCKLAFTRSQTCYDKANAKRKDVPELKEIFSIDKLSGAKHYTEVLVEEESIDLAPYRDAVAPNDVFTIVYTSGTTGVPKGAMLSHANVVSNVISACDSGLLPSEAQIKADPEFRVLSFLPLAHVFERVVLFGYYHRFVPVFFSESIDTIRDDFQEVQPFGFSSVPRLIEKVYERILERGNALTGVKRSLFFGALKHVEHYDPNKNYGLGYRIKLAFYRRMIFSKWKAAMGGNVQMILTGAAKMPARLQHIFWGAGIPIIEAYGMTEASPAITGNRLFPTKAVRIGSVGRAIDGVEVRIDPLEGYPAGEGEVLARGPNIMLGYYKMPEATAETIDADGWLHTGDVGRMDKDGFVFITDRKKEIFKTSQGKYVAPQQVENILKQSPYIDQIMVLGENRKFASALVVPNREALLAWAQENGISNEDFALCCSDEKVIEHIYKDVDQLNQKLDRHERVKRIAVLPEPWDVSTGELTPTLKMKRRVILEKYAQVIDELYANV